MPVLPRLPDAPRQVQVGPKPDKQVAVEVGRQVLLGGGLAQDGLVEPQQHVAVSQVELVAGQAPEQPQRKPNQAGRRAVQAGQLAGHDSLAARAGLVPGAGRRCERAAGHLRDVFIDGRPAHAQQPGDRGNRVLRPGQQLARVPDPFRRHGGRAAWARAAGGRRVKPGAGAVRDDLADELGERCEHVEHQPPVRGGGVQALMQRDEPDVVPAQPGHGHHQVPQRAAEPVQPGDHERVAWPQRLQAGREHIAAAVARACGHDSLAAGPLEHGRLLRAVLLLAARAHKRESDQGAMRGHGHGRHPSKCTTNGFQPFPDRLSPVALRKPAATSE